MIGVTAVSLNGEDLAPRSQGALGQKAPSNVRGRRQIEQGTAQLGMVRKDRREPNVVSPIMLTYRANDASPLLEHMLTLVREFDRWTPHVSEHRQGLLGSMVHAWALHLLG